MRTLALLIGVVVFISVLGAPHRVLDDPDPYLHVAVGNWMILHRTIPNRDIFSYSAAGSQWVPHEWLADIVMALVYNAFGWGGLVITAALCLAATLTALLQILMRYLCPFHAFLGTVTAAGLSLPHFFARPHMFSLVLLVCWVGTLVAARERHHAPPLYVPLIMILWANLHGSYIFGICLSVFFACEAVFEAPDGRYARQVARDWSIVTVLSLFAALVTPNYIDGILLPFRLMRMCFVLSYISEWKSPNFQLAQPLEFWLMLLLIGALSSKVQLPATRLIMLLGLIHMALQHQRHAELLGLVAPLLLAPSLALQLKQYCAGRVDRLFAKLAKPASAIDVTVAGVVVAITGVIALNSGISNDEPSFAPSTAVRFMTAKAIVGPVFNDINFGDYLIFSGIPVFIDGRVDMYGDAFVKQYAALEEFPKLALHFGFRWAILAPNNPHVALLDHLSGWEKIYVDNFAIIYTRTNVVDR